MECIGYFGSDGEGYDLVKALQDIGADTSLMVKTEDMQTCCYIKPMRGNGDGTDTELNRLDIRDFRAPAREVEDALIENLKTAAENASAVIILDQFMQRDIGSIEEGKLADLLILKDDPTRDAEVLCNTENIRCIVTDGRLTVEEGRFAW